MKTSLKSILYQTAAPFIRRYLKDKLVTKPIKDSGGLSLQYPADQHLSFLGQKEIVYEYDLQQILLREIEVGHLIFEIGSNIGQYSLIFAKKTGKTGQLICVEPDSTNFEYLSRNIKLNQLENVILLHNAVSDKPGKLTFYKDTITGGRMSSLDKNYTADHYRGISEVVDIITLANMIETYGTPHLIKVDTEGAEGMIFSSMRSLPRTTTYFVEVREETAQSVFNQFAGQGFSIFSLNHNMKRIAADKDLSGFDNWLIKYE